MRNGFFLTLALLLSSGTVFCQQQKAPVPVIRVGLGLMGSAYAGDLNFEGEQFYRFYPGFDGYLQLGKPKLIRPQIHMGFGKFVAQNRLLEPVAGYDINKYVETSFFYADLRFKLTFLRKKKFQPYFSLGPELLNYTPRDADGNALSDNFNSRKENETYGSVTFAFPLSLGFDLALSPVLGLNADFTFRTTSSDYLDNIGELGGKSGNDKLNTLTIGMYVNFDPDYPVLRSWLQPKARNAR